MTVYIYIYVICCDILHTGLVHRIFMLWFDEVQCKQQTQYYEKGESVSSKKFIASHLFRNCILSPYTATKTYLLKSGKFDKYFVLLQNTANVEYHFFLSVIYIQDKCFTLFPLKACLKYIEVL